MFELLKRRILNKGAYLISFFKLRPILRTVHNGSLVLDCGANCGDISLLFARRGATVVAFEPDPVAFSVLQSRLASYDNVTCLQKGVAGEGGKANMYFHRSRGDSESRAYTVSSSIIREKKNIDNTQSTVIDLVDLDQYIDTLGRPVDVLKMDIEGAEIELLNKMIASGAARKVRLMLVETHETKIPGHEEKVQQLKELIRKEGLTNIKLNWV